MISKAILRQMEILNHQLVRSLFILNSFKSISSYQLPTVNIGKRKDIISELIRTARSYSTKVVEYAEIKDLPNHPKKLLIDVREQPEVKKTGRIPTSINIPLRHIAKEMALNASPEAFQKKHGRPKPDVNTYIIVNCRTGTRAQEAAKTLKSLGYKNVYTYSGSWLDWAKREGLPTEKK